VKNIFVVITLLFSVAVASYVQALNQVQSSITSDGEYVGLERMPNLSPEDRDTSWFHENTLLIRNDEAILDKVPITIRHGEKTYSASDGGFLTYRARFIRKDGQSFVVLRLFQSDYIAVPLNKHDRYTEIKTYPVKFVSGRIEFDGVTYKPGALDKIEVDRLVHLLSTEPLEKTNAGR
jgi:hypothetical protein